MDRIASTGDVVVGLPSMDGPAFHICQFPVPAPLDVFERIRVLYPRRDSWAPGAFIAELPGLLLPEGFIGGTVLLPPLDVYDGLCVLWAEDPQSPLLVPISTLVEVRTDREWGVLRMATPASVGVVSADTLADVAWAVLCRVEKELTFRVLAELSCLVDRYRSDPTFLQGAARAMQAPPAIRGRLRAAARSGCPLFHPRGVRWVLSELMAATDDERDQRASWRPDGHDDVSLIARAWFRSLRGDQVPGADEVLLATWLLQGIFRGADTELLDADRLLGAVASMGFGNSHGGAWWPRLERALSMWTISDDHPAVEDAALAPSALRTKYGQELGVPAEQWLAGNWALCIRWWLGMEPVPTHPVTSDPAELFRFPMENAPNVFTDDFVRAFRQHSIASLPEFIDALRRNAGDRYTGLGALPQSDSLACRNHPVVELSDGRVLPLSVELVAERATSLHRLLLGSRGSAATSFGRMFEAYVADQLDLLREQHLVVTEAELTAIVGQSKRCDALVAKMGDYLAIETSVQTVPRTVAAGKITAIWTMAERYQDEADQAGTTLEHLTTVTAALGVPRPTRSTLLVVSDTPVPYSPLFLTALGRLRPARTNKFVCGIAELELLVQLGIRGWDVPSAVNAWQTKPEAAPLEAHLGHMAAILRPRDEPDADLVKRWMPWLPVDQREAA